MSDARVAEMAENEDHNGDEHEDPTRAENGDHGDDEHEDPMVPVIEIDLGPLFGPNLRLGNYDAPEDSYSDRQQDDSDADLGEEANIRSEDGTAEEDSDEEDDRKITAAAAAVASPRESNSLKTHDETTPKIQEYAGQQGSEESRMDDAILAEMVNASVLPKEKNETCGIRHACEVVTSKAHSNEMSSSLRTSSACGSRKIRQGHSSMDVEHNRFSSLKRAFVRKDRATLEWTPQNNTEIEMIGASTSLVTTPKEHSQVEEIATTTLLQHATSEASSSKNLLTSPEVNEASATHIPQRMATQAFKKCLLTDSDVDDLLARAHQNGMAEASANLGSITTVTESHVKQDETQTHESKMEEQDETKNEADSEACDVEDEKVNDECHSKMAKQPPEKEQPDEESLISSIDHLFVHRVDMTAVTVGDIYRYLQTEYNVKLKKSTKAIAKKHLIALVNGLVEPTVKQPSTKPAAALDKSEQEQVDKESDAFDAFDSEPSDKEPAKRAKLALGDKVERTSTVPGSMDVSDHHDESVATTVTSNAHPKALSGKNVEQPIDAATDLQQNDQSPLSMQAIVADEILIASTSLNRCLPLSVASLNQCLSLLAIPSLCSQSIKKADAITLPDFSSLINFPQYRHSSKDSTTRHCVMCGWERLISTKRGESNGTCFIQPRNRGVCNACIEKVWVVQESNAKIKWCHHEMNFRPFLCFRARKHQGIKCFLKSCSRCLANRKASKRKEKAYDSNLAPTPQALYSRHYKATMTPRQLEDHRRVDNLGLKRKYWSNHEFYKEYRRNSKRKNRERRWEEERLEREREEERKRNEEEQYESSLAVSSGPIIKISLKAEGFALGANGPIVVGAAAKRAEVEHVAVDDVQTDGGATCDPNESLCVASSDTSSENSVSKPKHSTLGAETSIVDCPSAKSAQKWHTAKMGTR